MFRASTALAVLAMSIVMLSANMLQGMMSPFLPQHLDHLGMDQSLWSGIIFAIQPAVCVVSTPLVNSMLQCFGPLRLLASSLLLQAASVIAFGFSGDELTVMFLARAAQGFSASAMLQSNCVIITGVFTQLGLVNGLSELASGAGYALGPVVASFLYDVGGWQLPILACGGWMVGASVLASPLYYVAGKLTRARQEASCEDAAASQEAEAVPQDKHQHDHVCVRLWQICTSSLLLPGVSLLISNSVWGIIQGGFYTIHAANNLHMTEIAIAINIGASSTAATFVSLLVGHLSDRSGHDKVMVSGLFVVAFSLALLGPVGQLFDGVDNAKRWWEFSCMILLGLGQACSTVPGFASMMKAAPESPCAREACTSLFVAFIQAGMVFGYLLSAAFGLHFVKGTATMSALLCCYAMAWLATLRQPLTEEGRPYAQCHEEKRTVHVDEEARLVKV